MEKLTIFLGALLCFVTITIKAESPPTETDLYINSQTQQLTKGSEKAVEFLHFNDVWAYYVDTHEWVELNPTGTPPSPRRNHGAVYDSLNQRMLIFNGNDNNPNNGDLFSLSLTEGSEEWSVPSPQNGFFNYYARDPFLLKKENLVFGWITDNLNIWDLETNDSGTNYLTVMPGGGPAGVPPSQYASAVDEDNDQAIVFGGGPSQVLRSITLTSGTVTTSILDQYGDTPPEKWLIRSAIDPDRRRFIFFGGNSYATFDDGDYRDETYELDLDTNTWAVVPTITPPSARGQYSVAWDSVEKKMYLLCGLYRVGPEIENVVTYNEVWVYNSQTQSWHQELPTGDKPEARRMPTAVFDELNRRIILFGGELIRPVAQAQTVIKIPQNGRKVSGNRLTVFAELVTGTPDIVNEVRFQYRQPSITGTWTDIPAAGINHPNPDPASPYFIHWDVSSLPNGLVDLRAIAKDIDNVDDTAPDDITIEINHSNPETQESINSNGHIEITFVVDEDIFTDIGVSDDPATPEGNSGDANVRVRIPPQTLPSGALLTATFENLSDHPALNDGGGNIGFVVDIDSSTGDTSSLANPVVLIFNYPDDDNNGIVDNTIIHEETLSIYTPDSQSGLEELSNVYVDPVANTVQGETTHFSLFTVKGLEGLNVQNWELME